MRIAEMGTDITRSSNIFVFSYRETHWLCVQWGTGFVTFSFSDALNFKNIGKREKRDQKIRQRNFINSEAWLAPAMDWNKLEGSRCGTNFH